MASERFFICRKCQQRQSASAERLFDLLQDFPKLLPICSCGAKRDLFLIPPFALGAGGQRFLVLDAFQQRVSWKAGGYRVTFIPFLVVLENLRDKSQKVWLPYWHKDGPRLKYGERAPWMDATRFDALLEQARAKGYFRP
jgi:hypothetical protein